MATATTMDDVTAGAVRQALAAAAFGRIAEACTIGEQALARGGDVAALNAMLGMLRFRLGEVQRAAEHLRIANSARPNDPVIANNLANSLLQLDRKDEALGVLTDDVVAAERSGQLLKLRGFLAQVNDAFELAIRCYQEALARDPGDCETWNNLGNAFRSAEQPGKAVEALRRAVELDPRSPPIRLNLASALADAGEPEEAEAELRRMSADFPDDPKPFRELHAFLKEQRREDEALEAIEAAHQRDPGDLELLLAVASQRLLLFHNADAEMAYREAISRDPPNALANLGLAIVFELTNRTDELAGLVGEAEQRGVAADALNFIRAYDHRRAKRYAEGLEALSKVSDDLETARRAQLLGQLHEGLGDYDKAFEAFTRMNEIQREDPSTPDVHGTAYRDLVRARHAVATPEWAASWREVQVEDGRAAPAFLVGFPRSGTTLLDTMLMGHPRIEVLEEEPALRQAGQLLRDHAELPTASAEQIAAARDKYFETAASITPLEAGNLLIDKNPLLMNSLPLIRRLFPEARIILALRHPCDVVLSCFKANFKLNDGMASFLQLETAAELYDLSFNYLEHVQALMPMPMHRIHYEKVVDDTEGELRRLLEFLGVEWSDDVLDHETTAKNRGRIKTASYAQVVEPIYKRSAGRWQNYRKHLEPVIPVLQPWIDKFGYEV